MSDCVFCSIADGKIPCSRVFEDENVLAFLDINPASKGHILVIPRKHAEGLEELEPSDALALFSVIKKISSALPKVLDSTGFNLLMNHGRDAGQVIPHLHFHIIPRRKEDGLPLSRWSFLKFSGDHLNQIARDIASHLV